MSSSGTTFDQRMGTQKTMCLPLRRPVFAPGITRHRRLAESPPPRSLRATLVAAEGCAKAARRSSRFCGTHGKCKRCAREGCSKLLGPGLASLCLKHAGEKQIDCMELSLGIGRKGGDMRDEGGVARMAPPSQAARHALEGAPSRDGRLGHYAQLLRIDINFKRTTAAHCSVPHAQTSGP